jgi:uroporphyrinogen decarboxylase
MSCFASPVRDPEMTPRQRAIDALELRQPDKVPHFELEMQLTEEYFGRDFVSKQEWEANPGRAREYLKRDAELFLEIADRFDYAIIYYVRIWRPDEATYLEGIRVLREMDGGRRLIMAPGDATMAIPNGTDMVDLSIRLFERKAQVLSDLSAHVDRALERGERLVKGGIDGFALCADYCFNDGPFLSPPMFAEFVTPFLARLVAGYRQMGAYVIKHTDGDIMPILDQLIAAKPHALHSLDPMAGVDIAEIKRLYGRQVCLVGNVNCALMQTGTDAEILESCRYAMDSGRPGGGYIYSTSNVIFKGMPRRSYDMMLDFYREHCWY